VRRTSTSGVEQFQTGREREEGAGFSVRGKWEATEGKTGVQGVNDEKILYDLKKAGKG